VSVLIEEAELLMLPVRSVIAGPNWNDEVYQKTDTDEWFAIAQEIPWTSRSLRARGPFTILRFGEGTAA
jgi:hypothetical protein